MQLRFFSIPVKYEAEAEIELNNFLKTVRVITIHRELICQEGRHFWAIAVEYSIGEVKTGKKSENVKNKKKIDYREVLSPENFEIYAKLREWRKQAADREGLKVYNVLMNEHMAKMIEDRIKTKAELRKIKGIGDGRIDKYGDEVLAILKKEFAGLEKKNEKSGQPLLFDHKP
ncbi:HRDC domain-containing protein [Desulfobacterales bacterium HSG16]|nr:HRDC domain-containing protein [Desulfobacterales bacterium HSG16]